MKRKLTFRKLLTVASVSALCILALPDVGYAQNINTYAGNGTSGYSGDGGLATAANFYQPSYVATDDTGNVYICDYSNSVIRKVNNATGIVITIAGMGGNGGYSGDGGPATSAQLDNPNGVTVDDNNDIYIADYANSVIRKVDHLTGIITTVAGTGSSGFSGDGGLATAATLSLPTQLDVDHAGNMYIADQGNGRIRKVDHATGIITTIAGNGTLGFAGDGGQAIAAELYAPFSVVIDEQGNLYIADLIEQVIRKVNVAGVISTVAGVPGTSGYNGDNIAATTAELNYPADVQVDAAGNLYIADDFGSRIRKVDGSGTMTTIAGNGNAGYSGDGGLATAANINSPSGLGFNADYSIMYIADQENNVIRSVSLPCSSVTSGTITNSGGNVFCGSVIDTLSLTGASTLGNGVTYQWQSSTDGVTFSNVGTGTDSFITGTLTATTYYRAIVKCTTSNLSDTTLTDTITINANVVPGVAITVAPGNTVGLGQTVTFTATVTNGGLAPTYNWLKNNVSTGNTNATYVTNSIAEGDIVNCIVHSNAPCAMPDSAVSNSETMHVVNGVKNVIAVNSFSLYPNPNQGGFGVEGVVNSNNTVLAEVMNVTGQVIYTTTLPVTNHYVKAQVTLPANIASGVYQLLLKTDDGSQVQRFTIEK